MWGGYWNFRSFTVLSNPDLTLRASKLISWGDKDRRKVGINYSKSYSEENSLQEDGLFYGGLLG